MVLYAYISSFIGNPYPLLLLQLLEVVGLPLPPLLVGLPRLGHALLGEIDVNAAAPIRADAGLRA